MECFFGGEKGEVGGGGGGGFLPYTVHVWRVTNVLSHMSGYVTVPGGVICGEWSQVKTTRWNSIQASHSLRPLHGDASALITKPFRCSSWGSPEIIREEHHSRLQFNEGHTVGNLWGSRRPLLGFCK